jgi:F420-0:gamma-glutamyl ligase
MIAGLRRFNSCPREPDLFGRPLTVTLANRADAVAVAAVGIVGEGAECIPAVVVGGCPSLVFNDSTGQDGFLIPAEDDLFAPLLACFSPRGPSPPRAPR